MRELFVDKRFNRKSTALLQQINAIIRRYSAAGFTLSLRQLYYQLVAAAIIENSEKSYKNIGNLVSDGRLAGLIDWDAIEDRGRVEVANSHWTDPAHILDSAAASFRIDLWEDQPEFVMVMVEKQALEGVLIPVCRELDVPFIANKGYSSSSALYELGGKIGALRDTYGKDATILYLGDHDPSGIDMTRDVVDRLCMFSRGSLYVKRIALNMEQINELQPPENPAKVSDSRFESYMREFGESSWELDAIEPSALAELARTAIYECIDESLMAEALQRQETMRGELQNMARRYRENLKE